MPDLRTPLSASDHVQGNPKAAVVLVEYGDFQCPGCGQAYPIVKAVQAHFGDRLLFAFRHFPLTQAHPFAQSAAETAEWAGSHERFWEMHAGLYENQQKLGLPLYMALARALDLPVKELRSALDAGVYAKKVRSDFIGGVRSGVNGTPAFYIDGVRHDGSYAFATLVTAIQARMA